MDRYTAPMPIVRLRAPLRVFATRDAGASWSSLAAGLPDREAYLTVLRQAFDVEGEGEGLGLYVGATNGEVFGSADGGGSWFAGRDRLPKITSVRVA